MVTGIPTGRAPARPLLRDTVMDRDATSAAPPPPDVVPPVAWETARKVGLLGAGLTAAAAALGLAATLIGDGTPSAVHTARLLLVFVGTVTAGLAISFRPEKWEAWAIGAAAGALAVAGIPAHWDSFRMLLGIFTAVAVARLVLVLVPTGWRLGLVSAFIVFHFGGIFMATTSPPPTPWFVDQVYNRVYNQYLQFAYLRNAYHFYSPQPGPASILACLIKTEKEEVGPTGETRKGYDLKWVVLPTRPKDIRDPLGLTYYRRLSITDQISRGTPDLLNAATFEQTEMSARRGRVADQYPLHPTEPNVLQYRVPSPEVARFLLPSYAQHLILENTPTPEAAARTTILMYRLEHQTLGVMEFTGKGTADGRPGDPYHPVTYRPYFLGEFELVSEDPTNPGASRVRLRNPQEPMLYWLLPVLPRPGGPAPGDPAKKDYVDYMAKHAGLEFDWSQLR
jgi:hypothetical protein